MVFLRCLIRLQAAVKGEWTKETGKERNNSRGCLLTRRRQRIPRRTLLAPRYAMANGACDNAANAAAKWQHAGVCVAQFELHLQPT